MPRCPSDVLRQAACLDSHEIPAIEHGSFTSVSLLYFCDTSAA